MESASSESLSAAKKPFVFECEICSDKFVHQLKFFEHLKSHYDAPSEEQIYVTTDACSNEPDRTEQCEDDAKTDTRVDPVCPAGSKSSFEEPQLIDITSVNVSLTDEVLNVTTSASNSDDRNHLSTASTGHLDSQTVLEARTTKSARKGWKTDKPASGGPAKAKKPSGKSKAQKKTINAKTKGKPRPVQSLAEEPVYPDELDENELYELEAELDLVEANEDCRKDISYETSKRDGKVKGSRIGQRRSEVLKCPHCQRVFNHRNSLVYHMRGHTGERPHQCHMCGKRFFATSALKVHMRLHSGEKPYNCNVCDKSFRQWGDLKYHMISIHSDVRQYQCEFCGKDFARKYSLIVHRRIHTGERNYQCEYCNKSFRAASYLQNHRRIHTGEKPHPCSVCGKPFRVRSDMKRHMASHNREIQQISATSSAPRSHIEQTAKPIIIRRSQSSALDKSESFAAATGSQNEVITIKTVAPSETSIITLTTEGFSSHPSEETIVPEVEGGESQNGIFQAPRNGTLETVAIGNSNGTLFVWPVFMSSS